MSEQAIHLVVISISMFSLVVSILCFRLMMHLRNFSKFDLPELKFSLKDFEKKIDLVYKVVAQCRR